METMKNKVVIITGGNSGIGYATAAKLKAQGATVAITGRKPDAVKAAATELGVTGYVADQANLQDTDKLIGDVTADFGKVDVLFINAGVGYFAPIEHADEAHFDSIMDVNFKGAYFTLNKFIPILNDGASVILLSSVVATMGMANGSVYAASKAALNSVARTASLELAPRGIRVNIVSPGPIDTPIISKSGLDDATIQGFMSSITEKLPLKRIGKAAEVANLVAFLAGNESSYITGSEHFVDGGANVNV